MDSGPRRSRFAALSDEPEEGGEKGTREEHHPLLNRSVQMGLAAVAIGGVLTLVTYLAADANNGHYFVFKGALVIGGLLIFRGLVFGSQKS